MAILAALVRRGSHRRGRAPRRLHRRRRAVAHVAGGRRVPRHRRRARPRPQPPDRPLRLLRHLRVPRTAAGSPSARSSLTSSRNLCRIAGLRALDRRTSPTTPSRTTSAPAFRAAFAAKPRDEWVARRSPPPTPASPRCGRCPSWSTTRSSWPAGSSVDAEHPTEGRFRQLGPLLAGMDRTPRSPRAAGPDRHPDRRAARRRRADHRRHHRPCAPRSRRMTDPSPPVADDVPAEIAATVGEVQYETTGEFPVEHGLRLQRLRVGRERQPAVLGPRGRRGAHRRADRAAHDALGLVPPAPLGARTAPRARCRCRSTSTSRRRSACPRRS